MVGIKFRSKISLSVIESVSETERTAWEMLGTKAVQIEVRTSGASTSSLIYEKYAHMYVSVC